MVDTHAVRTSDYLLDVQSVLHAGQRLRQSLDAPASRREFAISQLERAATRQEAGGKAYQAFMFNQLDVTPETAKVRRERVAEDALASIVTDLEVANVLLAAGRTLGEKGPVAEPVLLDEALAKLRTSASAVEEFLPEPLQDVAETGRFGFSETTSATIRQGSADLATAIAAFKSRAEETLTLLIEESEGVVVDVLKATGKLDPQKVLEALGMLGEAGAQLPKIGRLIRQGLRKLQGAINALVQLLGNDALTKIKEKLQEVWTDLQAGKQASGVLEWAYAVASTRARLTETLGAEDLDLVALDAGSEELQRLQAKFKEHAGLLRGALAAVTLLGTIVVWGGWVAGPPLALATAFALVLIVAAVVLIGMDYADSGSVLRRVRGVGEIIGGMRPARA
jgi:hypothetical protein